MHFILILVFSIYFSIWWLRGEKKMVLTWGLVLMLVLERISGPGEGLSFFGISLGFAWSFSTAVKNRLKLTHTFLLVLVTVFSTAVLFQVVDLYFLKKVPGTYIVINMILEKNSEFLNQAPALQQMSAEDRLQFEQMQFYLTSVLPKMGPFMLFALMSLFTAAGLAGVYWHAKKIKLRLPEIESPMQWRWQDGTVYILILGWLVYLVGNRISSTPLIVFGLNTREISEILYLFQGLIVLMFWFKKIKMPGILQGMLYISLIFMRDFLSYLGAFDTWFDFRGINKRDDSHK